MRWRKLGRVFEATQGPSWMSSHAAYPTPLLIGAGQLRVFFCCRDGDNRGSVAWVDVDPVDPLRVLAVSQYPQPDARRDRGVRRQRHLDRFDLPARRGHLDVLLGLEQIRRCSLQELDWTGLLQPTHRRSSVGFADQCWTEADLIPLH